MPVLVVTIDLSQADLMAFDAYETQVLALLPRYGGRIERRLRADNGAREFHILHFTDNDGYAAFLSSPERAALQAAWPSTAASATVHQVTEI